MNINLDTLVDEKNNQVYSKELEDENDDEDVGFKIADFSRSHVPNIINNNDKDIIAIDFNSPEVNEYYEFTDPTDEEDDEKKVTPGNQSKLDSFDVKSLAVNGKKSEPVIQDREAKVELVQLEEDFNGSGAAMKSDSKREKDGHKSISTVLMTQDL